VHGLSLSRRFIRDTGLFSNLLAVCGSIDEEEVEKYLNRASLELVALYVLPFQPFADRLQPLSLLSFLRHFY
jgi:hypothetical protein